PVANVAHAAAVLAVVQRHRRREARPLQVDDEPRGIGQREVLNDRSTLQVDHDLDLAAARQHAHPANFTISRVPRGGGGAGGAGGPANRLPPKGRGADEGAHHRAAKYGPSGVSAALPADTVASGPNRNSATVIATSRA